jgi:hypothetical protein
LTTPRTEFEREHRQGLIVGAVVGLILGLALYPPLVFGGVLGAGAGLGLARSATPERDAPVSARTLVAVAALLAVVLVLGELVGLGAERHRFLRAWTADGPLQPEVGALAEHPWAWLPQTVAIGALVAAAVMTAVRRR